MKNKVIKKIIGFLALWLFMNLLLLGLFYSDSEEFNCLTALWYINAGLLFLTALGVFYHIAIWGLSINVKPINTNQDEKQKP